VGWVGLVGVAGPGCGEVGGLSELAARE
jgi:hypothetical protein